MTVTVRSRRRWREAFAAAVLAASAVTVIALDWLGATGQVPWGYNAADHLPIWSQYLLLSAIAVAMLGVVIATTTDESPRHRPLRRWMHGVGLALCVVTVMWGVALWGFAVWGGQPVRGVALSVASTAPGFAVASGLLTLGYAGRRWTALVPAVALLAVGALATALSFS